jgi:hypothetical protein
MTGSTLLIDGGHTAWWVVAFLENTLEIDLHKTWTQRKYTDIFGEKFKEGWIMALANFIYVTACVLFSWNGVLSQLFRPLD